MRISFDRTGKVLRIDGDLLEDWIVRRNGHFSYYAADEFDISGNARMGLRVWVSTSPPQIATDKPPQSACSFNEGGLEFRLNGSRFHGEVRLFDSSDTLNTELSWGRTDKGECKVELMRLFTDGATTYQVRIMLIKRAQAVPARPLFSGRTG